MSANSEGEQSGLSSDEPRPKHQRLFISKFGRVTLLAFFIMAGLNLATRVAAIVGYAEPSLQTSGDRTSSNLSAIARSDQGETWECEVAIVGGSLGGVAAAYHAMQSGATTCLIELTPMLGGQISSQGVSAIDESELMRQDQIFPASWNHFKQLISQQPALPSKSIFLKSENKLVVDTNSCWVGDLCFTPTVGAAAAKQFLQEATERSPSSRWETNIAFKGLELDPSGKQIISVYAIKRKARDPNYIPQGRLSQEISAWYSWESDDVFEKSPIRLQAPPGKRMIVIDATDTGELVGWANIPHRIGSESFATTTEPHARADNPACTQAFTFPFVLAIGEDAGVSRQWLSQVKSGYPKKEHRQDFSFGNFPIMEGRSFFNYRRIISTQPGSNPNWDTSVVGDMTVVNWNPGNDWGVMNPPLILQSSEIQSTGQDKDWRGGLNVEALSHGEDRAFLFSEWVMQQTSVPLKHLSGQDSPMPTQTGLSIYPYIREGRRILGRPAYGQPQFFLREQDIRVDLSGGRDFSTSSVGITHYAVDMHGCRYRDYKSSGEASSAATSEHLVKPISIPLEGLIPQKIDNLLIGGKAIAVSHIVNAATRVHVGEWVAGSAAGSTAAWLIEQQNGNVMPYQIVAKGMMPKLQEYLRSQGITFNL
jgi:hypothetical protein